MRRIEWARKVGRALRDIFTFSPSWRVRLPSPPRWVKVALEVIAWSALVASLVSVLIFVLSTARTSEAASRPRADIVGAWFVSAPDAPFPRHVFVFRDDGTMQQSNPDAGDTGASDSDGGGAWTMRAGTVVGRFGEVRADRASGAFLGTGVITFTLTVSGDRFTGGASAEFFDAAGRHERGPLVTSLSGQRITAPDGMR